MVVRAATLTLLLISCATAAADTVAPAALTDPTFDATGSLLTAQHLDGDALLTAPQSSSAASYAAVTPQMTTIDIPIEVPLELPTISVGPPRVTIGDVTLDQLGPLDGYLSSSPDAPGAAVSPVPLPPAAWAGLTLVAGIALAKFRRRGEPQLA